MDLSRGADPVVFGSTTPRFRQHSAVLLKKDLSLGPVLGPKRWLVGVRGTPRPLTNPQHHPVTPCVRL